MDDKIVRLRGAPEPNADGSFEPVEKVVAKLESLLARAQRGEIRAFAIACVAPHGHTSEEFAWPNNEPIGHALTASITYMQHRYVAEKLENSYEKVIE